MIRKARKSDFEAVYPILNEIFDEIDMDTINRLPASQFYDLIRLGFISENYRYSYNRIWVETDENDRFRGEGDCQPLNGTGQEARLQEGQFKHGSRKPSRSAIILAQGFQND